VTAYIDPVVQRLDARRLEHRRAKIDPVDEQFLGRTLHDILADPGTVASHDLIDGLIDQHATMITGAPNIGKTSLTLNLIAALLTGEPFLGRETDGRQHRVVMFNTDPGGDDAVTRRMAELLPSGESHSRLRLAALRGDPTDDDTWKRVSDELIYWGTTVMVVDNLIGLLVGDADINNTASVKPGLDLLTRISRLGIAVILIGHTKKADAGKGRGVTTMGAQAIEAWHRRRIVVSGQEHSKKRKLTVRSNNGPPFDLDVQLDGVTFSLVDEAEPAEAQEQTAKRPSKSEGDRQRRKELRAAMIQDGALTPTQGANWLITFGHYETHQREAARAAVKRMCQDFDAELLPGGRTDGSPLK
jgi:hypothetical protein